MWTADDISNSLQDFIICVEMFCFAIAHHVAFNPLDFAVEFEEKCHDRHGSVVKKVGNAVIDAMNVKDIVVNAKDVVDIKNSKSFKRLRGSIKKNENVDEYNEEDDAL